jgi:putative CocE/NonD family hydrolase
MNALLTFLFAMLLGQAGTTGAAADEGFEVSVPMRDGVTLGADVFLPGGSGASGRWTTVLVRTPYNRKLNAALSYRSFMRRGYAVVLEDLRGRFGSGGQFGYISEEGPDGNDTINWIAGQRWSNGRVVMAGASFLGITQWWAALQNNPHLITISPVDSGDDEYSDRFYSTGGNIKLGHLRHIGYRRDAAVVANTAESSFV